MRRKHGLLAEGHSSRLQPNNSSRFWCTAGRLLGTGAMTRPSPIVVIVTYFLFAATGLLGHSLVYEGLGSYSHRNLLSYYERDFGTELPTKCYRSSFNSPYRIYYIGMNNATLTEGEDTAVNLFNFKISVESCLFQEATCCQTELDSIALRIDPRVEVVRRFFQQVLGSGSSPLVPIAVDTQDEGGLLLSIPNEVSITPSSAVREYVVTIATPAKGGVDSLEKLCPYARVYGTCDAVAYNKNRTCCTERATFTNSTSGEFTCSLLEEMQVHCLKQVIEQPPDAPSPFPSPSPLPPSPPPPFTCDDDMAASPFRLEYVGKQGALGSDTAFLFHLTSTSVNSSCGGMSLSSIDLAVDSSLDVKYVMFNNLAFPWTTSANTPGTDWITVVVNVASPTTVDAQNPIDLVVVVRGMVDNVCPANTCQHIFHGDDGLQHCCPIGVTNLQTLAEDCCVDDIGKAPYRVNYVNSSLTSLVSEYSFTVELVTVTNADDDGFENQWCDRMSAETVSLQIYTGVSILAVTWNGEPAIFQTHSATAYSKWIDISLNSFFPFFDNSKPPLIQVQVAGFIQNLCPTPFGLKGVSCEFSVHGRQSNHNCCPHGIVKPAGVLPERIEKPCGCTDDVAFSPYRVDYVGVSRAPIATTFFYDVRVAAPIPETGLLDCSAMDVNTISLAIAKNLNVQSVSLNGLRLNYQILPYSNSAAWLRIIDVDYKLSDFNFTSPMPLSVTVDGAVTQLCAAAYALDSKGICEYVIDGKSGGNFCCPHGMTLWQSNSSRRKLPQTTTLLPQSIRVTPGVSL